MTHRFRAASLTLGLLSILGTAGCGDEPFVRADFVRQVTKPDGGLDKDVANCVYDLMADDAVLVADIGEHGGWSDDISAKSDTKLQKIVARCLLAADQADESGSTTTTDPATKR